VHLWRAAGLLALLVWVPAAAEVGVVIHGDRLDNEGFAVALPYVNGIVDDPDPIGFWDRFSPTSDTRRRVLNADGGARGDGPPSMIFHSGWRRAVIVWSRNFNDTGEGFKIVVSEFRTGAWSAPRRINAMDGEQVDPALTIGNDGTLYVVFGLVVGAEHGVWMQSLTSTEAGWSSPQRVSQAGEIAVRPSATVHQGSLVVAYEVHSVALDDTAPKDVVLSTLEDNLFLSQVVASSSHDEAVWPQVHSSQDKVWVDWIDFTATGFEGEMAWVGTDTQGNWTQVLYEFFSGQAELEFNVRQAIELEATAPENADHYQLAGPPIQTP
jgi:hypothetical protein